MTISRTAAISAGLLAAGLASGASAATVTKVDPVLKTAVVVVAPPAGDGTQQAPVPNAPPVRPPVRPPTRS